MNKKKVLKTIGIVLVLILVLLIVIIFMNQKQKDNLQENKIVNEVEYEPTYKIMEVENAASYMAVNNCINSYLNYIYDSNSQGVYDLLIDDYISKNKINENNIFNKVEKINYNSEYMTKKLYKYDREQNIETYFVFGNVLNKDDISKKEYNFVLNIDMLNMTFEIAPYGDVYKDYIDYSDNDNLIIKNENLNSEINSIEQTDYNEAPITIGVRR